MLVGLDIPSASTDPRHTKKWQQHRDSERRWALDRLMAAERKCEKQAREKAKYATF